MTITSDDDPFEGYGLSEDPSDEPHEREGQVAAAVPQSAKEPLRYELPPPAAFELQPVRGPVKCDDCHHYVEGGKLTIDRIYEAQTASLFDLIRQCREFEKSFEVRELEQIVEKAKTLDEKFDERPRIRGYCAAGQVDYDSLHLIAEIKNHDGKCADFLPGRPPIVSCSDCAHRKPASQHSPSLADYEIDFGDTSIGFPFIEGAPGSAISTYVDALRNQYSRQQSYYDRDEEEYNQRLQNDVMEVVFNDRSPENFTLDWCGKHVLSSCAAANKSSRCTDFLSHKQHQFEELKKQVMQGPMGDTFRSMEREAPTDHAGKNLRKWMGLRLQNEAFAAESERARKANFDRMMAYKPAPLTEEQKRIPCFDCVHKRDPVTIDPFATVHFNNPDIMTVRDRHRTETARKANDERRICSLPGPSLGDTEVPTRHIWCDLQTRKQADGKVQEYAYCYRVLRTTAPNGECPGFRSKSSRKAE